MIHIGTFDGTVYYNPVNKYSIIQMKTKDQSIPQAGRSSRRYSDHLIRFTAVGYELPRTDAVEVELDGEWKQSRYGMQFQVEQWREIVPKTRAGVEGYSRTAIPLKRWLARYHELTGGDLTEYFNSYHRYDERLFALMVERKAIDLWQFFEKHKADGEDARPLKHIRNYAVAVSSWRCFKFVQKLLEQYTFSELRKIFGRWFQFHEGFVKNEGNYSTTCLKTRIARPFLTAEQHRQLYEWVDASVFQTEPEKYDAFVLSALEAPEIRRLYEKPALAAVLRQLDQREKCNRYELNRLKKEFYTQAELEAEQKEAEEQEKAEREAQRQRQILNQKEDLDQIYDGSARSLAKFARNYRYNTRQKEALDMVFEKLLEWPAGTIQTLPPEDAQCFFELCGELVGEGPRPRSEILKMIRTVIGGDAA